jgi:ribosomal protein S27AE
MVMEDAMENTDRNAGANVCHRCGDTHDLAEADGRWVCCDCYYAALNRAGRERAGEKE